MASDFNSMAEKIETQIRALEDEAVSKQRFADNLAHEIRTPLTSVLGYAEYMQKAPLDEVEIIESAQYIIDEAKYMKHIANSLLELATLRHYEPEKVNISVAGLFDEVSRLLEEPLRENNIRLNSRGGADVIYGQEDLIKSLLINLCYNAIKSCAPETGEIILSAEKLGGNTVISVTDNGCGISPESIDKVTEPFYRADKSRSREHGGAGLGLTLCGRIAEAHGAEMTVKSVPDMGTSVKIIFTNP
jgi:signal transduction histidine kinase